VIAALLGALLATSPIQTPAPQVAAPSSAVPGSELTIYLMTMGTGDQVWERFGHNAIRIVDQARGTDSVYNWGTFDFKQPNFITRFLTGSTLYWMQGDPMQETVAAYRYLNRSVWVQELDLTPAERASVRDFIAWNAKEENRYYRYDYYLDNCSTRVRDVIDRIVGGQLKAATATRLTGTSYRFHTQLALRDDAAVAMGTNIGLGEVADRDLSQWEEAFLPERLQAHVRELKVRGADGTVHPLVKNEQQLFAATRPPMPDAPPNVLWRNLAIGVLLAALLAWLASSARKGGRMARRSFATLATIWATLNGIFGILFIVGWTATRHVFMARNENLLQFDPLSLALAFLLPFAIARGRSANTVRLLARVVAVLAVVGLVIKVIPVFNQVNLAVIAMTLPVHLALAWGVRTLVPGTAPERSTAAARAAVSRSAA